MTASSLRVTRGACATRRASLGSRPADIQIGAGPGVALAGTWREFPVPLNHVAATVMLAWPGLFDFEACMIRVETRDTPQLGRIVITHRSGLARLGTTIDKKGLFGCLRQAMERDATQAVTVAGRPR